MSDQKQIIRTVHTITVTTEIPFPDAFPSMNITEAVEFQKNLDLESVLDNMVGAQNLLHTDVQVLHPVQTVPQEAETTRAKEPFTEHSDG